MHVQSCWHAMPLSVKSISCEACSTTLCAGSTSDPACSLQLSWNARAETYEEKQLNSNQEQAWTHRSQCSASKGMVHQACWVDQAISQPQHGLHPQHAIGSGSHADLGPPMALMLTLGQPGTRPVTAKRALKLSGEQQKAEVPCTLGSSA